MTLKEDEINMEEPSEPVSRMVFLEKKGREETWEEYVKKWRKNHGR